MRDHSWPGLLLGWLMGAVCCAPASSSGPADCSTKHCTHRRAAAWRTHAFTHSNPPAFCRAPAAGVPGVKPVRIELTDFTTKEVVDELEVRRGSCR